MEKQINKYGRYQCPCCRYYTLDEGTPNSFDICSVCFWEDDGIQSEDLDYDGGANTLSLNVARDNFIKYGVSDLIHSKSVRPPNETEFPD